MTSQAQNAQIVIVSNKKTNPVSRSGRFQKGMARALIDFTQSVSFDWRLWKQDIIGSIAHARMLQKIGILNPSELREIIKGLEAIGVQIDRGEFSWNPQLEDVHMNIEAALTQRTSAGSKLHTARSRNDQIALDMRMWLRDDIVKMIEDLRNLQRALVDFAARSLPILIPGYTHLQRAQPILFAHHLLAYVEMLERDIARFIDALGRVNVCPLGSGALAGSTLALEREKVAKELGFVDSKGNARLTQNSMDAVSDRDFLIETMSAAALSAVHLSRLSEDVILWSSTEFGFIQISDAFTTGSSLLPHKKNPDLAELTRGKSARVIGNLLSMLTLIKGLPMTYNRDLQEDKERLFDTSDTLHACLCILAEMLFNTHLVKSKCQNAAKDPALLTGDLADYLVKKKVPFREAHHLVGTLVALAEDRQMALNTLSFEDFQSIDRRFEKDVLSVFSLDKSLENRQTLGTSGMKEVKKQIRHWQKCLKQ